MSILPRHYSLLVASRQSHKKKPHVNDHSTLLCVAASDGRRDIRVREQRNLCPATGTLHRYVPASSFPWTELINLPPYVSETGLGFIVSAFCAVTFGFFLRMYLVRRRIAETAGGPAPRWIDVFFSIVEHRGSGGGNGRNASSGFLYFEPGYPGARRFMGRREGKAGREDWVVPTLFECDVEAREEQEWGGEDEELLVSSHVSRRVAHMRDGDCLTSFEHCSFNP